MRVPSRAVPCRSESLKRWRCFSRKFWQDCGLYFTSLPCGMFFTIARSEAVGIGKSYLLVGSDIELSSLVRSNAETRLVGYAVLEV